ncbi:unnamed protein product [Acanthoscelides obtectus]|uniref:PiggyBac transposable element-derived protein domain-containing protein n=1 Tax=Acanthoscelides obtectus TaxID=200917 RepID=A0A9P0Q2N3_ACAOB|nr:unnamed protein product [Acanthoscelides obtectus]CAK1643659.1 hypothetical protein AOBTE_LOCUS13624 [Acanthoscelides obtectus]
MDRRRLLSQKELEALIEDIEEISESEPFSADSSGNFDEEAGSDTSDISNSDIDFAPSPQVTVGTNQGLDSVIPDETFEPAQILPPERECKLAPDITTQFTPMQDVHKVFPHSLYLHIANSTNERLKILNQLKRRNENMTDKGEIQKLISYYAALGTCMSNRKNVPSMGDKLQEGESQFRCTSSGLLCVKWQETKEVLLMSNCHKPNLTTISKRAKPVNNKMSNVQRPYLFTEKKCKGLIGQINPLGYMIMTENQQSGG